MREGVASKRVWAPGISSILITNAREEIRGFGDQGQAARGVERSRHRLLIAILDGTD